MKRDTRSMLRFSMNFPLIESEVPKFFSLYREFFKPTRPEETPKAEFHCHGDFWNVHMDLPSEKGIEWQNFLQKNL